MKIKNLSKNTSVSDQLILKDLEELNRLGVKTIVCNRPDNEQSDQVPFEQVKAAARLMRIDAISIPFVGEQMTSEDIDQLVNILKPEQRIHLYCRSGARSALLWAVAASLSGFGEGMAIKRVNEAGYKLDEEKLSSFVDRDSSNQ